ncbi:HD domain-containing protein [Bradymonas sediminis]|uniref:Uncharacterized protein n=1 Tax=Bradymonas sediminis TaxID=1548548 RepID=A0A2Z4FII8_9DELT|nr:HD domain-containing protein [Bradymonas sediminis]AWV88496.1 hypothetical protein DN745_03705 [Bradymonas sediminis]TDP77630.1 HD domain-containing protein [Bradymonas sediminis]
MSYSEQFDRAFAFASKLHRDQTRKGKDVPYINHLMGVASLVGTYGGDEKQVIAALLHDAVEDYIDEVPDIRAQILGEFGPRVATIVDGCTQFAGDPKLSWSARKQTYLDHLHALPNDSPILLVSLCDKVYNARAIVADLQVEGDRFWERFSANRTSVLWYYRVLSNIFLLKNPGYLADELTRCVNLMSDFRAPRDAMEAEPVVYFFHGLESGPHGSKYQRLSESFHVFSPDFQGMDIWARFEKIERETRGLRQLILVGSSYGGLLASLLYSEKTQEPGYTKRPSAKVLNATFEFLQFQTGLLYDQPGFKMQAKHEQAFKLKITKLWASLSAAQQRQMSTMPVAWSKLNGQWNALDDTQKQAFTKSYQKKWMDEITLKSRKATDSATREKYQKQLVDYLVMRKKIAQAKDSQARAARQAKRSKKRANKSHKFDPNAGLRMQTEMMQMDMLNQSYRNLQIARSWD